MILHLLVLQTAGKNQYVYSHVKFNLGNCTKFENLKLNSLESKAINLHINYDSNRVGGMRDVFTENPDIMDDDLFHFTNMLFHRDLRAFGVTKERCIRMRMSWFLLRLELAI